MSMSTHAVGFKPADDQWNKMKSVWEGCEAAGVDIPQKVLDYFGSEEPGDKPGMEIDLGGGCREWRDDHREGFEIDIESLPEGVRFIRVYNSY